MNTNDSELTKTLAALIAVVDLDMERLRPKTGNIPVKDVFAKHIAEAESQILKHYRSVRDIREAVGEEEEIPANEVSAVQYQVLGKNLLRISIRSSLNLDGEAK